MRPEPLKTIQFASKPAVARSQLGEALPAHRCRNIGLGQMVGTWVKHGSDFRVVQILDYLCLATAGERMRGRKTAVFQQGLREISRIEERRRAVRIERGE